MTVAAEPTVVGRSTEDAVLSLENVSVAYGGGAIEALNDVNLVVRPAEIVVLLGSNGAGKTTMLRTITGLLSFHGGRLNTGHVLFEGRRIDGHSPWSTVRGGIGLVMEGRRVLAELSVEDNLRAGGFITRNKAIYAANYAKVMQRSRDWPSAELSALGCCPAVNSKCSPWVVRSCSHRGCCCSTSPPWGSRR